MNLAMTPRRAWSRRGQRAVDVVPFSRGSNVSVLAAMRSDGISAWQAFDGAVNGERFLEFIETKLGPTLRPGDVIVLDNVRFHHMQPVREAVGRRGARLVFIPAYHPELNAIEELFSFLKSCLRRQKARTLPDLMTAIRKVFDAADYRRIAAFMRHALQISAQPS